MKIKHPAVTIQQQGPGRWVGNQRTSRHALSNGKSPDVLVIYM